jgi:hypothetical protein
MPMPTGEPTSRMERIQEKLSELAEVLSDISSRMKQIADQRRGGLRAFEEADGMPDGLCWPILLPGRQHPPEAAAPAVPPPVPAAEPSIRYAQFVEFSTHEELLKFKELPPIRTEDLAAVDWEDLERRLVG